MREVFRGYWFIYIKSKRSVHKIMILSAHSEWKLNVGCFRLYLNSGSGTASPDGASAAYKTGDIVGCGIDFAQAKVNADGTIKPQQTLTVYFTKNGKKVSVVCLCKQYAYTWLYYD